MPLAGREIRARWNTGGHFQSGLHTALCGGLRLYIHRVRRQAWNLTRMPRPLKFCDQFRIGLPGLLVLRPGDALA